MGVSSLTVTAWEPDVMGRRLVLECGVGVYEGEGGSGAPSASLFLVFLLRFVKAVPDVFILVYDKEHRRTDLS